MVKYKLTKDTKTELLYEYYPEGRKVKKAGVILYNKISKLLKISILAEEDYIKTATLEELLKSRKMMNDLIMEERGTPLSEDEWPIPTEGFSVAAYGDMALRDINKKIESGSVPKSGMVIWY